MTQQNRAWPALTRPAHARPQFAKKSAAVKAAVPPHGGFGGGGVQHAQSSTPADFTSQDAAREAVAHAATAGGVGDGAYAAAGVGGEAGAPAPPLLRHGVREPLEERVAQRMRQGPTTLGPLPRD